MPSDIHAERFEADRPCRGHSAVAVGVNLRGTNASSTRLRMCKNAGTLVELKN